MHIHLEGEDGVKLCLNNLDIYFKTRKLLCKLKKL